MSKPGSSAQAGSVPGPGSDPPGATQARLGIWIGCSGWLIGLLLVAADHLGELWVALLGGAVVTAVTALGLDRLALPRRPALPVMISATVAAIGLQLLYYALFMQPAIVELPVLVERLQRLGSVVEVPVWLGGALLVLGLAGFMHCRRAASA